MISAGEMPRVRGEAQVGLPVPIRAEIDLQALRFNVRQMREYARGVPLMAVVKANAYGHGVEHVVPALRDEKVTSFGVANVSEAVQLRALGVTEPILVFAQPLPEYLVAYDVHDLDVTVASRETAEAVLASGLPLRVHVKVDTGMHRLGLTPDETPEIVARLAKAPSIAVVAAWSHFATADGEDLTFAREQLARFDAVLAALDSPVPAHIANSGALVRMSEAVTGRALVRPGGLLYGVPSSRALAASVVTRPVLRLVSRVIHVQTIASGDTVSYGRTWTATRPTRLATVAAGYGDGLPRQLSNVGVVEIRGEKYPIAGRVCMDMLMLDLGPPAGHGAAVEVGDDVQFFGADTSSILDAADAAGTMAYTLTTGITARVPRVVVRE